MQPSQGGLRPLPWQGPARTPGLPCEGQAAISTPRQAPLDRARPDGRGGGGGFPAPPAWPRRSGTAMAAAPELRESLAQRLRDLGIATVTAEHPQVRAAATTTAAAVSRCRPWRCPGPFRGGWAGSGLPRCLSAPSGSLNPAIKLYAPTGQSRLHGSFVPYAPFFSMISYQYGISHQMDLQGLGLAGNVWGFGAILSTDVELHPLQVSVPQIPFSPPVPQLFQELRPIHFFTTKPPACRMLSKLFLTTVKSAHTTSCQPVWTGAGKKECCQACLFQV